jgi:hypothetical protein
METANTTATLPHGWNDRGCSGWHCPDGAGVRYVSGGKSRRVGRRIIRQEDREKIKEIADI